jgi:cation-transporting P-type ATPase 13A2
VVTIVVTLLFSVYMLLDPAHWLMKFMQLTPMDLDYRIFLVVLGFGGFGLSWIAEKHVLPQAAKLIGKANARFRPNHPKKRKQYKLLQEEMRI